MPCLEVYRAVLTLRSRWGAGLVDSRRCPTCRIACRLCRVHYLHSMRALLVNTNRYIYPDPVPPLGPATSAELT